VSKGRDCKCLLCMRAILALGWFSIGRCLLLGMSTATRDVVCAYIIEVFKSHISSSPLGPFVNAK
jgi:hypothetical protein